MKYLFVHQNFPGQYLHILRHLAASGKNEVVFITEPNANAIPGVRTRLRHQTRAQPGNARNAREFERAMRRAETVAVAAAGLKPLGFVPDIIIGHHGWGELLNLPDVWPDAPMLGYFEFYYHVTARMSASTPNSPSTRGSPRIRARNGINLMALALERTARRRPSGSTPRAIRNGRAGRSGCCRKVPGSTLCKPDPTVRSEELTIGKFNVAPDDKLVTYVARNLEPYRGFHIMMRALPHLLRARSDARWCWSAATTSATALGFQAAHGAADAEWELERRSRVLLPGQVPYDVSCACCSARMRMST